MLREMVQVNKSNVQHIDMHSPQIIKDEKAVSKVIVSKVIDVIGDLVSPSKTLVNYSTL